MWTEYVPLASFVTRWFLENILHIENIRGLNVSRDRIQDVKTGYVVDCGR